MKTPPHGDGPTFDVDPPLEELSLSRLPRAGSDRLFSHRREIARTKDAALVSGASAAIFAFALAVFRHFGAPFAFQFVLIFFALAFSISGGMNGLRLLVGSIDGPVLPEGATKETALLEDELDKRIREWNRRTRTWNDRRHLWLEDYADWRRQREHPARREGGWTEANSEMHREALALELDTLKLLRIELEFLRYDIERKLKGLIKALPPPKDPEKK